MADGKLLNLLQEQLPAELCGPPRPFFSELELRFQLNHPGSCITSQAVTQDAGRGLFQVKDLPQSWRRNEVVREAKIRMVEEIEELKANS